MGFNNLDFNIPQPIHNQPETTQNLESKKTEQDKKSSMLSGHRIDNKPPESNKSGMQGKKIQSKARDSIRAFGKFISERMSNVSTESTRSRSNALPQSHKHFDAKNLQQRIKNLNKKNSISKEEYKGLRKDFDKLKQNVENRTSTKQLLNSLKPLLKELESKAKNKTEQAVSTNIEPQKTRRRFTTGAVRKVKGRSFDLSKRTRAATRQILSTSKTKEKTIEGKITNAEAKSLLENLSEVSRGVRGNEGSLKCLVYKNGKFLVKEKNNAKTEERLVAMKQSYKVMNQLFDSLDDEQKGNLETLSLNRLNGSQLQGIEKAIGNDSNFQKEFQEFQFKCANRRVSQVSGGVLHQIDFLSKHMEDISLIYSSLGGAKQEFEDEGAIYNLETFTHANQRFSEYKEQLATFKLSKNVKHEPVNDRTFHEAQQNFKFGIEVLFKQCAKQLDPDIKNKLKPDYDGKKGEVAERYQKIVEMFDANKGPNAKPLDLTFLSEQFSWFAKRASNPFI